MASSVARPWLAAESGELWMQHQRATERWVCLVTFGGPGSLLGAVAGPLNVELRGEQPNLADVVAQPAAQRVPGVVAGPVRCQRLEAAGAEPGDCAAVPDDVLAVLLDPGQLREGAPYPC